MTQVLLVVYTEAVSSNDEYNFFRCCLLFWLMVVVDDKGNVEDTSSTL